MGEFLEQLQADSESFVRDFGEEIRFAPFQEAEVKVRAIIDRDPASAVPGFPGSGTYKHEIQIARHPRFGREKINKGKDAVWFSKVVGGPVEKYMVLQIIKSDQGMWHLGVG